MSADRVRVVSVDTHLLMRVFESHPMRSLESDWPPDARLRGAEWSSDRRVLRLLVESATFDEVPEGNFPPNWDPTFTVHYAAPELVDLIEAFRAEKH